MTDPRVEEICKGTTADQAKLREQETAAELTAQAGRFEHREGRAPSWWEFYRETLAPGGLLDRLCPPPRLRREFLGSQAYRAVLRVLTRMRERDARRRPPPGPQSVITVRLPKIVHDTLRNEAADHLVSLNQLCISKLLLPIPPELTPNSRLRENSPNP